MKNSRVNKLTYDTPANWQAGGSKQGLPWIKDACSQQIASDRRHHRVYSTTQGDEWLNGVKQI